MRHLIPSLLFASVTMLAATQPAAAQARYCLQGPSYGIPGDCIYDSYSQCMATASGQIAYCSVNPAYAFAASPRGGFYPQYPHYRHYRHY